MTYLKKLIFSIKEIVIVYLLQYLFLIGISFLYLVRNKDGLESFISIKGMLLLCLFNIIIIIYLYQKNKYKNIKINSKLLLNYSYLGINIAIFMNMIIFYFNKTNVITDIPLLVVIICSSIIGPILEEILFRYLLLNKLLVFNNKKMAIIISTIIFSLIHLDPVKIIYAFVLGLILNIIYYKYRNILIPIIIHISANLIVVFLSNYNLYLLVLSLIGLIINYLIIKKCNK